MLRKIILSILSGTLLGLSWNSFGNPFFIFFAFVPLLIINDELIQDKEKQIIIKIFLYSYLTFFIWNFCVIHWLGFTKRLNQTYAIEALLFPLLTNSLFMSITFTLYHWIEKNHKHYIRLLLFVCFWITFEKLHLHWTLSFPWLNLGNVFGKYHTWVQWYEYTGVFGGSLWILIVNVLIFHQYKKYQENKKNINIKNFFFLIFIFSTPLLISKLMYYTFKEEGTIIETIILQPKLDPYTQKYTLSGNNIVKILLKLTNKNITKNTNFIIAPETAFPGKNEININNIEKNKYIRLIKNYLKLKNNKSIFISGISSYSNHYTKNKKKNKYYIYQKHFNSAIQITTNQPTQIYHKSKLVLGVESIPLPNQLKNKLSKIFKKINFNNALTIQKDRSVFKNKFNNAIIAPIICYESIYGEYVTNYIKKGANILFIMTNDSWWEKSEGHKQLLMMTKLRAIETRKNIIRSANSGISCIINSKGDVCHYLNYLTRGTIQTKTLINNQKTIYVKYGDYIAYICSLLLIVIIIYTFLKKKISKI